MSVKILSEECIGCQACIDSCPYGAIVMKDDKAVHHGRLYILWCVRKQL